jgi:hypothetical protein
MDESCPIVGVCIGGAKSCSSVAECYLITQLTHYPINYWIYILCFDITSFNKIVHQNELLKAFNFHLQ